MFYLFIRKETDPFTSAAKRLDIEILSAIALIG